MKQSFIIKRIVSTEFLLLAVVTALLFYFAGFSWWWLFVLFPVVDISSFGYLKDSTLGAFTYNIGHSFIGPTIFVGAYVFGANEAFLFTGMVWIFHIFVDRSLGYGLKHSKGFSHTHLGTLSKKRRKK